MGTPVQASDYGDDANGPFITTEVQIITPSNTSSSGAFSAGGDKCQDCMIYNGANQGVYVVFSTVAGPTAKNKAGGASGTLTNYVPPGDLLVVKKGSTAYFGIITDAASAGDVYLHAGKGS